MKRHHTYLHVPTGWNVRDPDGVLVAIVPDSGHEHESLARNIARGLDLVAKERKAVRS